jgi:hypothetical protein
MVQTLPGPEEILPGVSPLKDEMKRLSREK